MGKTPKRPEIEDVPTEDDIKRGDEILKRMLQSKPKPHKEMVGKGKKVARVKASSSTRRDDT